MKKKILQLTTVHPSLDTRIFQRFARAVAEDKNFDSMLINANNDNFIEHFHKNNLANLTSICEDCHDNIHKNNLQLKRIKTTNGYTFSLKNNNSL